MFYLINLYFIASKIDGTNNRTNITNKMTRHLQRQQQQQQLFVFSSSSQSPSSTSVMVIRSKQLLQHNPMFSLFWYCVIRLYTI
nr:hypothetical protein PPFHPHBJ_00096 [Cydia pomonella granulovirus]WOZ44872.1 hypothetical protein HDNAPKKO_00098 [Cydia pomonella granulovirus]WOZ45008.1 hypothetical protein GGGKFHNK_00096 [Cydia pomonella granulovirus]WOZ45144.1 hypothetical protein BGFFOGFG_00096 [Cydia pomonella granulovirus]WOZ45665.1 hypothetical protein AAGMHLIN_00094 [Cydia pomonella granulovirus]